jgi:hypothetical protein
MIIIRRKEVEPHVFPCANECYGRAYTMSDHAKTCAHYGDSMMPCTCGAEPDIVGCHYDEQGVLRVRTA